MRMTTADAILEEIAEAGRIIAEEDPSIPVVLQIATEVNTQTRAPDGDLLHKARQTLEDRGVTAYIMPQLHVLAGWK